MARSSSGIVAGLTVAALAVIGFLGYQASASAPAPVAKAAPPVPAAVPVPSRSAAKQDPAKQAPAPVPADSGTGMRVVYSPSQKRVWLVAENGQAQKSFTVMPSTVHPKPGSHVVVSRSGAVTGSDGVPIEHVVRFATTEGVSVGFSARVDGATPAPDAGKKTGGIRMSRADGDAMWAFALRDVKVVVVP
ncbi:hypothetical protein [Streptomyces sp. NPDC051567]|uniref:hypothetical protein n=1 Tax=Streptomyces sp. NPDC051567 TaxID=3365660 RepID=UPI0037AC30FA